MRAWGKIKTEDIIKADVLRETEDFAAAVDAVCAYFDISRPIICAKHMAEIEAFSRTVFYADDFVEAVAFDTLEIEIIGQEKKRPE